MGKGHYRNDEKSLASGHGEMAKQKLKSDLRRIETNARFDLYLSGVNTSFNLSSAFGSKRAADVRDRQVPGASGKSRNAPAMANE